MKSIAEQLDTKKFPIYVTDVNKNILYKEYESGHWYKQKYDSNENLIYHEDSDGNWDKKEYDSKGQEIYAEWSNGYWIKRKWNSDGRLIYFEDSDGNIKHLKPKSKKSITKAEAEAKLGKKIIG